MKQLAIVILCLPFFNTLAEEKQFEISVSQMFVDFQAYGGRSDERTSLRKGSELSLGYRLNEHLKIKAAVIDYGENYLFSHHHIELGLYDIFLNNRSTKLLLEASTDEIKDGWRFSAGVGYAVADLDTNIIIRSQRLMLANMSDSSLLLTLGAEYQFSESWAFIMSIQNSSFKTPEAFLGIDTGIPFADGSGHDAIDLDLAEIGFGFQFEW